MFDGIKKAVSQLSTTLQAQGERSDGCMAQMVLELRVAFTDIARSIQYAEDYEQIKPGLANFDAALRSIESNVVHSFWRYDTATHMLLGQVMQSVTEAELVKSEGPHKQSDPEVRQAVLDITGGKCAYCGCQLKTEHHGPDAFVVEHVVPKSKGGPDNIVNFVPSCRGCNNAKSDRHVYHFISNVLPYRMAKAGGAS